MSAWPRAPTPNRPAPVPRRVYDLVERLFPAEVLDRVEPPREAFRHTLMSRYRAHGLLGRTGSAEPWLGTSPPVGAIYGLEGDLPVAATGRRVLHADLVEMGALVPVTIDDVRGERYLPAEGLPLLAQAEREVAAGDPPGGAAPGVGVPRGARPARLGPGVPANPVRLRLRLGGLCPRGEAAMGLLRPADPVRGSARRPHRAADRAHDERAPDRRRAVVGGRVRSVGRGRLRRGVRRSRRGPSDVRRGRPGSVAASGPPSAGRAGRPSGVRGRHGTGAPMM